MCLLAMSIVASVFILGGEATLAQDPTPTHAPEALNPDLCTQLSGDVRVVRGQVEVLIEANLTIIGQESCGERGEEAEGAVETQRYVVGRTVVGEDGSYKITGRLDAAVQPGAHRVIVSLGDGRTEFIRPIIVVATFAVAAAAPTPEPDPPRAGRNIVLLLAWGLALIAFGTLLVIAIVRGVRRSSTRVAATTTAPAPSGDEGPVSGSRLSRPSRAGRGLLPPPEPDVPPHEDPVPPLGSEPEADPVTSPLLEPDEQLPEELPRRVPPPLLFADDDFSEAERGGEDVLDEDLWSPRKLPDDQHRRY